MKQLDLLILERQDTEQERENNYTLPHDTILQSVHRRYNVNTEH